MPSICQLDYISVGLQLTTVFIIGKNIFKVKCQDWHQNANYLLEIRAFKLQPLCKWVSNPVITSYKTKEADRKTLHLSWIQTQTLNNQSIHLLIFSNAKETDWQHTYLKLVLHAQFSMCHTSLSTWNQLCFFPQRIEKPQPSGCVQISLVDVVFFICAPQLRLQSTCTAHTFQKIKKNQIPREH